MNVFSRSTEIKAWILALALPALLAFPACTKHAVTPPSQLKTSGYDLRGVIVTVDAPHRLLTVHHEEIPGYMPSMTMQFAVPDADFSLFKEGQHITARMIVDPKGELHLEGVQIVEPAKRGIISASTAALRQETFIRGQGAFREIGETVPAFTLYDQDNNVVSIGRFRGQCIVLNFIYTRCPIASMCPASTAKMMALQAAAKAAGIRDLQLVSITLDPTYDTPAVLKNYAAARGIRTDNFTFLTGPEGAVRDLMLAFGVLAEKDDNILKHTLATVLIDEKGSIRYRVDGSGWTAEDFLQQLRRLSKPSSPL